MNGSLSDRQGRSNKGSEGQVRTEGRPSRKATDNTQGFEEGLFLYRMDGRGWPAERTSLNRRKNQEESDSCRQWSR